MSTFSQLFTKFLTLSFIFVFNSSGIAETKEIKPRISLRPVTIKNIASSGDENFFAIPNSVTTGSIGIFTVSPDGKTVAVPARFSNKDFFGSRGVFYYSGRKDSLTDLAFIPLSEYSAGYSVSFTNLGDTLAICGGDKISIFASKGWSLVRTIDLKSVSRAVFSADNSAIAAVADGRIYVLKSPSFTVAYTIEPETGCKFADVAFSSDGKLVASFEYKNIVLDHTSRIRLFSADNGTEDRQLPWFSDKISSIPGDHFPLISFLPSDSALAVTLEKSIFGKVAIIKSNDGLPIREFKSSCHAISQSGAYFAAGGEIYEVSTWKKIGNYSKSALCMTFSAKTPYLLIVTPENLQRFRITN
jgi:WD40 repeat protein